jgi:alpha/beta superfamily hydrolase
MKQIFVLLIFISLMTYTKAFSQNTSSQTADPSVNYKNIDVSVKAKDVTLSGTLFQPLKNKISAAVLIIAGSGPTDRNGNSVMLPGKNNSLLQLADSLAQYGIATLRYDKRLVGKTKTDSILKEENLSINDIADDAKAMYDWLRQQGYQDIYIAGHSEGSLIGMMIAEKSDPKGFISIAGAGRKASDILKEQVDPQVPNLKNEFDSDIDSLEQGLTVQKVNPLLVSLLRPSVQPYMKSWLPLDPQKIVANLKCPVLILQGTKDLQIKEIDAQNLHNANTTSKLIVINNMNHVMKMVNSDERSENVKAYSDPQLPVSQELVKAIANFILTTR